MSKTVQEQIEVMTHFSNGAKVECLAMDKSLKGWYDEENPSFSWGFFDYRIKQEKKTITIEKWLCKNLTIENSTEFWVCETSNIDLYIQNIDAEKIKLIGSYEVEL